MCRSKIGARRRAGGIVGLTAVTGLRPNIGCGRRADLAGCQVGCAAARRVAVPAGSALGCGPVPIGKQHTVAMAGRQGLRPLAVFVCGFAGGRERPDAALSRTVRGGCAPRQ